MRQSLADKISFAVAQWDIVRGDFDENFAILKTLIEGFNASIDFLLLPELFSCGFCGRTLLAEADLFCDRVTQLGALASARGLWLAGSVAGPAAGNLVSNRFVLIDSAGKLRSTYDKLHLFPNTREPEFFIAGTKLPEVVVSGKWRISPSICFDLRFPRLYTIAVARGANLLVVPAQFPDPRLDAYEILCRARAIESQSFVATANRVGVDGNLSYSGAGMLISPTGEVVFKSDANAGIFCATIDVNLVEQNRQQYPFAQMISPQIVE